MREKIGADGHPIELVTEKSIIGKVIERYPFLIDCFVKLGFAPMKNSIAHRAILQMITLEQSAAFKGMGVDKLVEVLNEEILNRMNTEVNGLGEQGLDTKTTFILDADISFLGVVPCPLRNILIEKFDLFVSGFNINSNKKLGWTMVGEGTAGGDILKDITVIASGKRYHLLADVFTAVGKDLFVHNFYGGRIYRNNIWEKIGPHRKAHPELEILADPNGILRLLYGTPFILSCRENILGGELPRTWVDLTKDIYQGKIALPSLDLPIIPDLLGALYYHLGEENFQRFAANCSYNKHPAEVNQRKDEGGGIPGVFIVPSHFAEISKSSGAVAVYPKDGSILVPAFATMKKDAIPEAEEVLDYLTDKDYLEVFNINANIIVNHFDFPIEDRFLPLITRPWEDLFEHNHLTYTTRLVEMIRKRR